MSYYPFRKTGQGVCVVGEVNPEAGKPKRKRQSVLSEVRGGAGCARPESAVQDPKPVDLSVGRLKPRESGVDDRTGADVQIARMTYV